MLKRGAVVRAIAGNANNFVEFAERVDEELLVLGGRPRKHLKPGDEFEQVLLLQLPEDRALHDDAARRVDAALDRDGPRREHVVARAHLDGDAGLMTVRDGLAHTRAQRVLDTSDPDQGETC